MTPKQLALLERLAGGDARLLNFLAYVARMQSRPTWKQNASGRSADWVEIPSRTLKGRFRNPNWKPLLTPSFSTIPLRTLIGTATKHALESGRWDTLPPGPVRGVLRLSAHDSSQGMCQAFQLSPDAYDAFVKAGPLTAGTAATTLWTTPAGRQNRTPRRSPLYDDSRNYYPPLVRSGLEAVREGMFDAVAVERHLASLEAKVAGGGLDAQRRYSADRAAYAAVLTQLLRPAGGDVWRYRPCYRVATSGRIFQLGGGLQSASGAMKAAAYSGVAGVRNYDLVSSQLWGLRQLMEDSGAPCPTLVALLDRPSGVERLAGELGLPKKSLKGVIFGVLYGARLSPPESALRAAQRYDVRRSATPGRHVPPRAHRLAAPVREVLDGVGLGLFETAYPAVFESVKPFYDEVARWRTFLVRDFIPEHASLRRGDLYLTNAAGRQWNATRQWDGSKRAPHKTGKSAASHLLQGLEAAYTHALASTLDRRGVLVLANEHDGLVCLGSVLPDDHAAAQTLSGLRYATLVEKPFL